MKELTTPPRPIRFGVFEVDLRSGELRKQGLKIKLQDQPFEVLAMLLEHPGELVTREELQKQLWPKDTFVDFEHSLNTSVKKLREALGDDADNPRVVETLHRRGYRFIYPVEGAPVAPVYDRRKEPTLIERRYRLRRLAIALAGVVIIAGAVLAYWLTRPPPSAPPELTERRLTANPSENAVAGGAISPDGKYLAYRDGTGMHLKLVKTGETIAIPQPEGPAPDRAAWYPNGWFPDGTKFIASGFEDGQHFSAWVVSVMGGPPRKLRDDADAWSVSPDGTLIAFGTGRGVVRQREIWVMGAQGEEPRRLVPGSEDDGLFWTAWSPDGQRIAYTRFHRTPDGLECSIESRDLKGGQPTLVLSDPRLCQGSLKFLWYPDGRFIYEMGEPQPGAARPGGAILAAYPTSRTKATGTNLWETRVDTRTGHAVSKPRQLTHWVGVVTGLGGGTQDGKQLAVGKRSGQADVYVAELEANDRRLKNTRRLTLNENDDYPGQWLADSKTVLFQSDRNGAWDIFKQALDQAEAQPVVTGPDYKQQPVVSADGSWILYLSSATALVGAATPVRIVRVPTSGGAPQLVLEGRGIDGLACARSPATDCVFSGRTPDNRQLIFSAFDPIKGRGKELTRINLRQPIRRYSWDLSRDGSRLAFTQFDEGEGRIQILPLTGGETREVNVKGWNDLWILFWATDGKGLFLSRLPTSGSMLLYVDLEGRADVVWQQSMPSHGETWGVPSPDGRHLALVGKNFDSNVWLLENF
jgi:Tol biopolymer transport system component/DNA-binding winged helix-turn-helix (wHTH) protein